MTVTLISIHAGQPRTVGVEDAPDPFDRPWTSAIWKDPISGPARIDSLGVEGDAQFGVDSHGGVNQALLAYDVGHYAGWSELHGMDMGPGTFGENLAITGLDERSVSVGDVWRVGSARLEISEPRLPCWKLARRVGRKDMVERVRENGWSGWYLRVLEPGTAEAGDEIVVESRPHSEWTMDRVARLGHVPESQWDTEVLRDLDVLAELEALRGRWQDRLRIRLERFRDRDGGGDEADGSGDA